MSAAFRDQGRIVVKLAKDILGIDAKASGLTLSRKFRTS